eukprot:Opistho-1_new@17605
MSIPMHLARLWRPHLRSRRAVSYHRSHVGGRWTWAIRTGCRSTARGRLRTLATATTRRQKSRAGGMRRRTLRVARHAVRRCSTRKVRLTLHGLPRAKTRQRRTPHPPVPIRAALLPRTLRAERKAPVAWWRKSRRKGPLRRRRRPRKSRWRSGLRIFCGGKGARRGWRQKRALGKPPRAHNTRHSRHPAQTLDGGPRRPLHRLSSGMMCPCNRESTRLPCGARSPQLPRGLHDTRGLRTRRSTIQEFVRAAAVGVRAAWRRPACPRRSRACSETARPHPLTCRRPRPCRAWVRHATHPTRTRCREGNRPRRCLARRRRRGTSSGPRPARRQRPACDHLLRASRPHSSPTTTTRTHRRTTKGRRRVRTS